MYDILATGVKMCLYTHRLVFDIFSNRGYHILYTHRLMYDILATRVTMFCIRTDWCMIYSATGVTMFLYTHRLMFDVFSNRGYDVFVYAQTDV